MSHSSQEQALDTRPEIYAVSVLISWEKHTESLDARYKSVGSAIQGTRMMLEYFEDQTPVGFSMQFNGLRFYDQGEAGSIRKSLYDGKIFNILNWSMV